MTLQEGGSPTHRPWVLGLSASHNGAACLLHGNEIVAAIQEERLAGKKRARLHAAQASLAVQYCLDQGGIQPADLDMVVLCPQKDLRALENNLAANPVLKLQDHGIPSLTLSHHAGHAISAFATSGFEDAAILIVDGMGSPTVDLSADERSAVIDPWPSGSEIHSLYHAAGSDLRALEKHMCELDRWLLRAPEGASMPGFASLGGMFSATAAQIFGDVMEAGKVMGLAPYGKPTIAPREFFEMREGRFHFRDAVCRRFTQSEHWPATQEDYENLAASVQNALEEALLYLVRRARELSDSRNLVFAGGVALNSVANERIVRESDFDNVYFMPAAEDSGPAIGAAYYGLWQLGSQFAPQPQIRDGFGKAYSAVEVAAAIEKTPMIDSHSTQSAVEEAANLLADGKIIAWFTGPSELGPRALGQRSILCDPRRPDAKEILNARVKRREAFRPFAPVIPLESVEDWFDVEGFNPSSPYMLRVMRFREECKARVPAVVHVDGTGRVQTVTREANGPYYELVKAFGARTGVPILLNTSLNVMGEPVVETPEDALWCLLLTQLDACVFDEAVVTKQAAYQSLTQLYPYPLVEPKDIRPLAQSQGVAFTVATPWGPHTFGIADRLTLSALEIIVERAVVDRMTVSDVFELLRSRQGAATDNELIRLFAQLRRWRLISFR